MGTSYEVDPRLDIMFVKCLTSVTLVNLTTHILQRFYDVLAPKTIQDLLTNHLERTYKFAHNFNSQLDLRLKLWRSGFMASEVNNLPGLLNLEYRSLSITMAVYFKMYFDQD